MQEHILHQPIDSTGFPPCWLKGEIRSNTDTSLPHPLLHGLLRTYGVVHAVVVVVCFIAYHSTQRNSCLPTVSSSDGLQKWAKLVWELSYHLQLHLNLYCVHPLSRASSSHIRVLPSSQRGGEGVRSLISCNDSLNMLRKVIVLDLRMNSEVYLSESGLSAEMWLKAIYAASSRSYLTLCSFGQQGTLLCSRCGLARRLHSIFRHPGCRIQERATLAKIGCSFRSIKLGSLIATSAYLNH
jgi:hypothetical protein